MEDYQQRVIDEKKELDEKLGKLRVFIRSAKFPTLPFIERDLLRKQMFVMEEYSEILGKRIMLF